MLATSRPKKYLFMSQYKNLKEESEWQIQALL